MPFKYLLLPFIFCILQTPSAFAQVEDSPAASTPNPFWSNVRFGGSLGLGFGNGYFNGSLAPSAIYDFNQYASAGIGISGAYAKQNNFKATSVGGSIIGMLRPIRAIQLSAEYEQLNISRRYELDGGNRKDTYWVPALFLGIGYNTGPVVTGIRYDVLHDSQKSFYSNALMPFVSIYF
ncbi:alpha-ketoglutarate decarboxylase [Antarcticibacterium arcticum]|uniref:Alpha-ketoglutarate decarboxylase n=1 Tax=Antarcticibacterium arcticum TaxID=2585771 RepID=A0A5B8YN61_9FLAO|nr:alpha-ketoglutarate decarboxylase [Antarcticibacterium arcticum]QED38718.1 alpha-ketoglutarate decarboxylase [Antarcticibacterium arcticum]